MLNGFWDRLKNYILPSDEAWSGAAKALWGLWFLIFALLLWGDLFQYPSAMKALGFGVAISGVVFAGLAILLPIRVLASLKFNYRVSLAFAFPFVFLFLSPAWGAESGLLATAVLTLSASLLAGGVSALRARVGAPLISISAALIGAFGLVTGGVLFFKATENPNGLLEAYTLADRTLDLPDPSEDGEHRVEFFTYGSGTDIRRPEYGEGVTYKTNSVDGSKLVDKWSGAVGWARTEYWGFDAKELPVQGRVWMPEGEGPFPLVLIVHGNHGMEDFSDPGYAYLGEHLASNGFIFVSVDENFLNSSLADIVNPMDPGIGRENDARGWMLLEHLRQWRDWMEDQSHPLYGKADMSRLGLIGHSRGGEAVAIAAAFNGIDHYPDDATLAFDYDFDVKAVIAIAPVDGQYRPRDYPTPLKDVNYFTIHGSMDGDVTSFMGTSQYSRVDLTGDDFRFKASLYIEGANHGQFNTGWGRNDYGMPLGLLLDTRTIMDPEEQRQIAKVYFHSVLKVGLLDDHAYLPILKDARYGAKWLPDRYMINNYEDPHVSWLARFEEDIDPSTGTGDGVTIQTENLSKWRETQVDLKYRPLDSHVVALAWDERVHEEPGRYSITFDGQTDLTEGASLVFAAADAGIGTLPKGFEPEDEEGAEEVSSEADDEEEEAPLDWAIVLTDAAGEEARLALSHDSPLYQQVKAYTRRIPDLESGSASEVVMRRFEFPLKAFVEANAALDLSAVVEIRFQFDLSKRGSIVIDDIGFATTR